MHSAKAVHRVARFGLPVITLIGLAYLLAYTWPPWPVTLALMASGGMVGFLYFFLGGYGYVRGRGWQGWRTDEDQRPIEVTLVVVAAWDVLSPFVLRDLHPVSVTAHVLGGLAVLLLSGTLAWSGWRERSAVREASATPRGARKA